jgi:WhiB family redox-sensing transcriptional regulator
MPDRSLVVQARQAAALDGLLPCQHEDVQLWFSDLPSDLEQAKAHCRPCPIRLLCLAGAVKRREPYGVWGGEIFERGTITPRKIPRGRPPKTSGRDHSFATS